MFNRVYLVQLKGSNGPVQKGMKLFSSLKGVVEYIVLEISGITKNTRLAEKYSRAYCTTKDKKLGYSEQEGKFGWIVNYYINVFEIEPDQPLLNSSVRRINRVEVILIHAARKYGIKV